MDTITPYSRLSSIDSAERSSVPITLSSIVKFYKELYELLLTIRGIITATVFAILLLKIVILWTNDQDDGDQKQMHETFDSLQFIGFFLAHYVASFISHIIYPHYAIELIEKYYDATSNIINNVSLLEEKIQILESRQDVHQEYSLIVNPADAINFRSLASSYLDTSYEVMCNHYSEMSNYDANSKPFFWSFCIGLAFYVGAIIAFTAEQFIANPAYQMVSFISNGMLAISLLFAFGYSVLAKKNNKPVDDLPKLVKTDEECKKAHAFLSSFERFPKDSAVPEIVSLFFGREKTADILNNIVNSDKVFHKCIDDVSQSNLFTYLLENYCSQPNEPGEEEGKGRQSSLIDYNSQLTLQLRELLVDERANYEQSIQQLTQNWREIIQPLQNMQQQMSALQSVIAEKTPESLVDEQVDNVELSQLTETLKIFQEAINANISLRKMCDNNKERLLAITSPTFEVVTNDDTAQLS